MNELKSLLEVIAEKGEDYVFQEIDPVRLVGLVDGEPRVIRAILDRTAVVHPLKNDAPANRSLARLDRVMVRPEDIKWKSRPVFDFSFGGFKHG